MDRRALLAAIAGGIGALAGCNGIVPGDSVGTPDSGEDESTPSPTDCVTRENIRYIEQLERPPKFELIDIYYVTDSKMIVEASIENKVGNWDLTVYRTFASKENPTSWRVRGPCYKKYYEGSNGCSYWDEENQQYEYRNDSESEYSLPPRYIPWIPEPGTKVAEVTVPGGNISVTEQEGNCIVDYEVSRANILEADFVKGYRTDMDEESEDEYSTYFPSDATDRGGYMVKFELGGDEPPSHQPFFYTFTVKDSDGEEFIIDQTPSLLKNRSTFYVHPTYTTDFKTDDPKWTFVGWTRDRTGSVDASITWMDINGNDVVSRFEEDGSNRLVTRWSARSVHSPFLSDKQVKQSNHYGYMYAFEYEVTPADVDEAVSAARTSPDISSFREMKNVMRSYGDNQSYINNPAVQRVAQKLNDKCVAYGINETIDQLQLVTDFVSQLNTDVREFETRLAHPPEVLKLGKGDVTDKTMLLYALMEQSQFNISPEFGWIDPNDTERFLDNQNYGFSSHVTAGIPMDEVEYTNRITNTGKWAGENEFKTFRGNIAVDCTARRELGQMFRRYYPGPD